MLAQTQVDMLRDGFAKISRIDPCSETYVKLIALLDSLNQPALRQLADAKIKFVSLLALNRVK